MRSEVFDNYIKIALDKGMISEGQEPDSPTRNADYADTIKTLYNIELPLNDSQKDILEQAHPTPVIIAPSYDKVNGLVENLRERQDIMAGIAMKPANGNLTMHRYATAYNDLVRELVAIGFKMDNKKKKSLRVLADSCSYRVTKLAEKFVKKLAKKTEG